MKINRRPYNNKARTPRPAEPKDEDIEIRNGRVIEALPGALFRIGFEDNTNLISYIGGRMRVNKIKVFVGDRVAVQIDEYGGKGRVVKRL